MIKLRSLAERAATLSVFFVLLLSTSCETTPPSSHSHRTLEQLRISISQEPPTLDPRKGGDVTSSYMHFLLFEGLTKLNPDGSITPAQAQTIEISSDGLVYTFTIRDTYWSNGDRVTAYDFEYAWKKILHPTFPAPNAHLLYPIKNALLAKMDKTSPDQIGIYAPNPQTLIVTLEQPTPYFLDLISFCVFFPIHHQLDQQHPNWDLDAHPHFVSNGPYQLSDWKHQNELTLHRHVNYWNHPHVIADTVHISIIPSPSTALQMFEKGSLDILGTSTSPLPIDALAHLHKQGNIKTQPVPGSTILSFNTTQFPFNNVHIRQAFAYAIDRSEIVTHITQMNEPISMQIIPPILQSKSHPPASIMPDKNPQELLTTGLDELGITLDQLPHMVYYYPATDSHHHIAQVIQNQIFNCLGIQLQLQALDTKFLLDKLMKRDYTLAQTTWIAQYRDPMSILERFKFKDNLKNYSNWENADYIRLLDQSVFETGSARLKTLEQAETIFINEMPITPIYHWEFAYILQPHLSDMELSPIGDLCIAHPQASCDNLP